MNWVLVIFAVSLLVKCDVTDAVDSDVIIVAANQLDDRKVLDTSGGPAADSTASHGNTASDDVNCTSIDDVTEARRSLCPAHCRCSPLDGQDVWTKLTVDSCSGDQSNFTQDVARLLSICTTKLQQLTITHTPLTTIPEAVCRLSNVKSLHLDSNRLASLPSNCFTHMHNLTSFSANSNRLTSLQEGVFANLYQLTGLDLADNIISFVEPRVFDESANLTSLDWINLARNRLTALEPWPLIRAQHRPMHVDLSSNRIANFTNALRWSFDCNSTRVRRSRVDLSSNDIQHMTDAVRGWNIDGYLGLICLLNAATGDPKLDMNIDYTNGFNCDCKDFSIIAGYRFFSFAHWLDRVNCDAPSNLYSKKIVNVQLDLLVCEVTDLCPPGCSCIKRPYNYSFEVSCPPATLNNSLPYRLPDPNKPAPKRGRFDLRFGGSSMKFLESRDYFNDSFRVDLSRSRIETVTDEAWRSLQKVEQVVLSGNRLVTLPRLLQTENITFRWIALHDNPLSCECEQRWLATWLRSLGSALQRPDSVKCHSPDWLRDRSIVSLQSDDFCRNPESERLWFAFKIVVPTVAGAILLVSACFVMLYRYRVKVFATFNVHPFDVDECDHEGMAFDAFVSCAWPDDDLAQGIVDRLEGGNAEEGDCGGYRVCYHTRDFPLGGVILRSIQQAIEHSKRVICVLSDAFLSSEFCMLEFRTAFSWNVEHGKHRLIVVKCPGVDEALAAAERDAVAGVDDVRMFLSTYTYIEHGSDSDWWQRLLYAMPINRLPNDDPDFHQRFFAGAANDDEPALLQNV